MPINVIRKPKNANNIPINQIFHFGQSPIISRGKSNNKNRPVILVKNVRANVMPKINDSTLNFVLGFLVS